MGMTEDDFNKIEKMMAYHVGIAIEDARHRSEILAEGQQMLAETMERMGENLRSEILKVDQRVMNVAADLAAHRKDTEAHGVKWSVREKDE